MEQRPGSMISDRVGDDKCGSVGEWVRRAQRFVPWEALVWIGGVTAMATMDPAGAHLFRLCPLDALGFTFCPGCGLGHSVAYLARGAVMKSVHAHPLGGPAVLILIGHSGRLIRQTYQVYDRSPSLF